MSLLRKVIKHKIATKRCTELVEVTQRHQDAQFIPIFRKGVEKQVYILEKTLRLCVFVAKKRLFGVDSVMILRLVFLLLIFVIISFSAVSRQLEMQIPDSIFSTDSLIKQAKPVKIKPTEAEPQSNGSFENQKTSSDFLKKFYHYFQSEQFLDNYQEFVIYETETLGDISIPDASIFSFNGNSYKWNKYYYNNFRFNDNYFAGNELYKIDLYDTDIEIDKFNSQINFFKDTVSENFAYLQFNRGGLGGPAPYYEKLIHTFHRTAREALYEPINEQRKINGAINFNLQTNFKFKEKELSQNISINSGQRTFPDFDYSGIKDFYPENFDNIQSIGELPLIFRFFDKNNYMFSFLNRNHLFAEQYFGKSETAKYNNLNFSVFGTKTTSNQNITTGINFSYKNIKHNDLNFSRNIIDQDGESFEPWYSDANVFEISHSYFQERKLLKNLNFKLDAFNSLIQNNPINKNSSNSVYYESWGGEYHSLYSYDWNSNNFTSGLLENTAGLDYTKLFFNRKLTINLTADGTFDGFLLKEKSRVNPNWQSSISIGFKPFKFFEISVNAGKKRIAYNYDYVRFLSNDYHNAQVYYWNDNDNNMEYSESEKGELFTTTGGKYHNYGKNLKQPEMVYLEIPLQIKLGKKQTISIYPFFTKYYNQWLVRYDNPTANSSENDSTFYFMGSGLQEYLLVPFTSDYMEFYGKENFIENSPLAKGYTLKYQRAGNKLFFSASWTAIMVFGYSALGNGINHNYIGVLSESLANPNTQVNNSGRMDADKAYIGRLLLSYNISKKFSCVFQLKYKDGQPFSFFETQLKTDSSGNQIGIRSEKVKGENPYSDGTMGARKDAHFNTELRLVYNTKLSGHNFQAIINFYNIYDFGTELAEYTFSPSKTNRYVLELNMPRGIIIGMKYSF